MIVIICLDDDNGMVFNKRRQSRDRAVIERICKNFAGKRIFVSEYSAELFSDKSLIHVDNNFLENAEKDDVCFVEKKSLSPYIDKMETIIVYRWNRKYPSDIKLDIPLIDSDWSLISSVDFAGHSHEKITEEIYKK